MSDIDPLHMRIIEALIFASPEPVSERAIQSRLPNDVDLSALLVELQTHYESRGVNLVRAGKSWAFRTAQDVSELLNKEVDVGRAPSRAAIETLAICAYHQPVTRAEIEEIRGVSLSKGTLDLLFEANWIKPRGRRQTPGRPVTWGTTDAFLDHFGLNDIRDLPGMEDLKAAGLLESGPAINAYASRGSFGAKGSGLPKEEELDEEMQIVLADEDAAELPPEALMEEQEAEAEPLDPDEA
ncbi:MAG: SMC-Scp complex subunit ScpB [Rhodospirillales bacterium]|jgi:segregation and condensation protein B|tara:strand:- start:949 stop:1668 length:720 start_codon:yes stop_codon:yes gene_type:complete